MFSEFLYFQATSFAGSLSPLPIGLVELDASFTLIDGGLDDSTFSGLSNLNWVYLDGLTFNQSIPSGLATLPNLEYLYISDAKITGDLSYLPTMTKIIEHWADRNPSLVSVYPTF